MQEIRIGLVGSGWMGRAHATAFRNAVLAFGPEPAIPVMEMVCDVAAERASEAVDALGFKRRADHWREVVSDPRVDVVDIATPNSSHVEIARAAIANRKHIYCEKPLALSAREAKEITQAAEQAGIVTSVGFNYLRNPIQALAKKLIATDQLGTITGFRATFDQDVMTDPNVPFTWRMDRAVAGSGALGDMGSHAISLAHMLVGPILKVCGMSKTFIRERPVAKDGSGYKAQPGSGKRAVENEDIAQFLCQFENGAMAHFATSRVGTGRKLGLTYEVQGQKGAICFNQERMNELDFFRQDEPMEIRGYKTIYTGPDQPGYAAFHPIPGVALSYNDQKTLEVRELIESIMLKKKVLADFRFGYQVDRVIEAVLKSIGRRGWVFLNEIE